MGLFCVSVCVVVCHFCDRQCIAISIAISRERRPSYSFGLALAAEQLVLLAHLAAAAGLPLAHGSDRGTANNGLPL